MIIKSNQTKQNIPEFEHKITHKQERKWARRIMYQPWRRFDFTIERERVIIYLHGQYFAHPNTIEVINQQLKEKEIVGQNFTKS